jgi:putative peptide zinc metalloprotease protein
MLGAARNGAAEEVVLLPIRQDLRLYPAAPSAAGAPQWTVFDPLRQCFFLLGHAEFRLLSAWRAGISAGALRARLEREQPGSTTADEVASFQHFLLQNELLAPDDPAWSAHLAGLAARRRGARWRRLAEGYLFFRVPLLRPDALLARTLPYVRVLASRPALFAYLGCALLGLLLVSRQWDAFVGTFPYFFSTEGLLAYVAVIAGVKIAHEFGHAYAAKACGVQVPAMGVALLVLWPVLYTDTTEAWKLRSRRARLWITAAGMTVELALAGIAALAWCLLPDGVLRSMAFVLASVSWVLTLVVNLNPFMRFDGYYLLADWLEMPNLQQRSFDIGRWWLRGTVLGIWQERPEVLPRARERLLLAYALATWCYRAVVMVGIALLLYHLFWKPLGIALMLLELWLFVAAPVVRELAVWRGLAGGAGLNRAQRRSLALLGVLAALLIVPWQQSISRIALLRPAEYARVYAPEPGYVRLLAVAPGIRVEPGQPLLGLAAPELDYERARAASEVATLRHRLERGNTVGELRELGEVAAGRLAEAEAVQYSVNERIQRLQLRSPLGGRVVDLDETLQAGRWVQAGALLMLVVADERQLIETFVPERELSRLDTGGEARFYPHAADLPPFDARVVAVDRASAITLPEPWFADRYAGDVPTRAGAHGELKPHEAVYRVLLEPLAPLPALPRMLAGHVLLEVSAQSVLGALAEGALGTLRREAGL